MINAMRGQIHGADARAATEGSAAMQQAKSLTVFDKADSDRIRQNLLEYVRASDAQWPSSRAIRPTRRPTMLCIASTRIPRSPAAQRNAIEIPRRLSEQPRQNER